MLLNNNSMIMQWNRDENGNPISWHIPTETQQISPTHGVVQLVQVPDQLQRISIVTEDNIQLTEVFNIDEVKENCFYVDYGVGIVQFHKDLHGKFVKVSYYGRGVILLSDSRIFHRDGENVTDTWDNILNRSQDALDLIESAGGLVGAMEKIDQKVEEGNAVADRIEGFVSATEFFGYTILLSREAFVVKADESGDVARSEINTVFSDVVVYKGGQQITPIITLESPNGCEFEVKGQRVLLKSIDINVIKANVVVSIDCGDNLVAKRTLEVTKVFDGISQYAIEMTNPFYSFEADSNGSIEKEESITCELTVTKANVDYTNYTIAVQNAPRSLQYRINSNGVTFTSTMGSSLPDSGSCLVVVTIDNKSYNKTFTWNKTKKGQSAKSLTVVGGQILRYENSDYSGIPSPHQTTVTAKINGLSGTPKWYCKTNSGWEVISGQTGLELTFPHNDALIWGSRKETTVKCELDGYSDELTIVKLSTGASGNDAISVILSNESHTLPVDNSGAVSSFEIENTSTVVTAFVGTESVIPTLSKGKCDGCDVAFDGNIAKLVSLDNSFTTATAVINVNVNDIIIPKVWSISKSKQGNNGENGNNGSSFILNVINGTRSFSYTQLNTEPRPTTSAQFVAELYENGVKIEDGVTYSWLAHGHVQGSSINSTFTPTIRKIFDESITNNAIQLTASYKGQVVTTTVPISITKDASGLDWVSEWDQNKVEIKGNRVLAPKIFAGQYEEETDSITGVAIGVDILNGSRAVGVAGYQNNKATFLLDTDGTLMVGNPHEEGSTGIHFDGTDLTIKARNLTIEGTPVASVTDVNDIVNSEINTAKSELQGEMQDVTNQINNLDTTINGAFKDGILDTVERVNLQNIFDKLSKEVEDVTMQYNSVSSNPNLDNQAVIEALDTAYETYLEKYNALVGIFGEIMEETIISQELVENFNLTLHEFNESSATLYLELTNALTSISMSQAQFITENAKTEIRGEISDVSDSLSSLEQTMNGEFKAGIINTLNATVLKDRVAQLEKEKADIDGQYKGLAENTHLGEIAKQNLANVKSKLDTEHARLIAKINSAIADMIMTEQELREINDLIVSYGVALGNYSEVAQKAAADIALNLANGAVEALNQESIFNKLTNNGEKQGLYLQDGKIYINGEYINSKNFKAVRNDGTETFKIDSEGNVHIHATTFHLVGDDTNVANKDYVDSAVNGVSVGSTNIILSNESQVIPTTNSRYPFSSDVYTTKISVYQGTKEVTDFLIQPIANAYGMTVSIDQRNKTVSFATSSSTRLTADNGSFTISIVANGLTINKKWTWAVSKQGMDAYYIVLNGEQAFKYTNNFSGVPTPSSIRITSSVIGIDNPTRVWEFRRAGEDQWHSIGSATSLNESSYEIAHNNSTIWTSGCRSITIRCSVGDVSDQMTIVKVSDGAKGDKGDTGQTGPQGIQGIQGVKGDKGDAGQDAKSVDIVATSQVFKSTDGGQTFTPDNVKLKPILQNVTFSNWQYSTNGGSTWSNVTSGQSGLTISNGELTISKNSSLFTNVITSIAFRVNTNNSAIYDTMTVTRLYDVTEIQIGTVNRVLGTKTAKQFTFNGSENNTWNAYSIAKDISDKKVVVSFDYETTDFDYGTDGMLRFQSYYTSLSSGSSLWQPTYDLTNTIKPGSANGFVTFNTMFTNMGSDAQFRFRADRVTGTLTIKNVRITTGTMESDWSPAPEDIDANIGDVQTSLNNFQNTVNTTFKDGIIEESEAIAIRQHLNTLETEKADVDKEYNIIYNNSILSSSLKSELSSVKTEFNNAHSSIKSFINNAISDNRVTESERNSVNSAFLTYNDKLSAYRGKVQQCLDYISTAKVNNIQIGVRNLLLRTDFMNNNTSIGWSSFSGVIGVGKGYLGSNMFTCDNLGGSKYTDALQQILLNNDNKKVKPSTWYTFSFYVKGTTNNTIVTHIYPSLIDTSIKGIKDGIETSLSTDGYCSWNLTEEWTKHTYTFKTKSVLNSDTQRLLFRFQPGTVVDVCMPKLEEGNKSTDWQLSQEDIDAQINSVKNDLQTQVDGKVDTYSQTNDPSTLWTDSATKEKHRGDIWYNPSTKITYRYTGSSWERLYDKVAEEANQLASQKRRVFVTTPTVPYDIGDLWIKDEELYRCTTAVSNGSFNQSHWTKAVKYTDDSYAQSVKQDLDAFEDLEKWLVINNQFDTYFPYDENLQTTSGINPNSGYNAYLVNQGKFGNCLSVQEDVVNLFPQHQNTSSYTVKGADNTKLSCISFGDEEVVFKYIPTNPTSYQYWGTDIGVVANRTYTLSGWMYVSEDYNSSVSPQIRGEQGFARTATYDINKKGQWQFFTLTGKPTTENARILMYAKPSSTSNGATAGYVLYKNIQFTQTGVAHMFVNGSKPKDIISYNVSQPDVSTMMAYKKHILDSLFKHQALVKNGNSFTFYENGVATTSYLNKWKVYAVEGITTPSTDGKNISNYNKPLSTKIANDLTGTHHAWNTVQHGYMYRTFLYCSEPKTIVHKLNFDNFGCAYCNGVLAGSGAYVSTGNTITYNLIKGWNCIEICYVDNDSGGNLSYVAGGSDGLFSNKTAHPEILYMSAELPIEMANNKVTYFSRANCYIDEAVILNKNLTSQEVKVYFESGKRLTDPARVIDVPEPTEVTFTF